MRESGERQQDNDSIGILAERGRRDSEGFEPDATLFEHDYPLDELGQGTRKAIEPPNHQAITSRMCGRHLPARRMEWPRLHRLIKADAPSPFPALTSIACRGR